MNSFKHLIVLGVFTMWTSCLLAQPYQLEWLNNVKCPKNNRTLALLKADGKDFYLLRLQKEGKDPVSGNDNAAVPMLTVLAADGDKKYNEPIPNFSETGDLVYRFAAQQNDLLFIGYENSKSHKFYVHAFNFVQKQWLGKAIELFSGEEGLGAASFRRSTDGQYICVYLPNGGGYARNLSFAVFGPDGGLQWHRKVTLPKRESPVELRQLFCTNQGKVMLHTRVFDKDFKVNAYAERYMPMIHWPDGRPLYHQIFDAPDLPSYANALYLFEKNNPEMSSFYPSTGLKYSPTFQMAEDEKGMVFCTGFGSDEKNTEASHYFIYKIDPQKNSGEVLRSDPIPMSLRRAFMKEKLADQKLPIQNLTLRWLDWADNGKPWMLVERENFEHGAHLVEAAAILRLDSTYKIVSAKPMEKYHKLTDGSGQSFATVGACATGKGNWSLLWNKGTWPEASVMLTDAKGKDNDDIQLSLTSGTGVSLLPHTVTKGSNGIWYFVGESEYHERFRVGFIEKKRAKSK